jgi:septal ring factor EnvC (AmiA/AmiB activator)
MANGSDRLAQIEARFEAKSEARDQQIAELVSAHATSAESIRQAEDRAGTLETRIAALEQRPEPKPPSVIEVWGPAVATALALGSLGAWVVDKSMSPVEKDIARLESRIRVDADTQRHLEIEYAEKYGLMAGKVELLEKQALK